MASRPSADDLEARGGASRLNRRRCPSAVGRVFQALAQGLTHLQETLRVQQDEAERKVEQTLRLQEQTLTTTFEQKLREKDEVIRVLQQRLVKTEERRALPEESMASGGDGDGDGGGDLQRLEPRAEPAVRVLAANIREEPGEGSSAMGEGEEPQPPEAFPVPSSPPTPTPSSSGPRYKSAAAAEIERARRRVEELVRNTMLKREQAAKSDTTLGEELCKAAREGRLNEVRRLLDSGADINYCDQFGLSPLHHAFVGKTHSVIGALLLRRGADPDAVSASGNSVLHWAASNDPSGCCVDMLVEAKCVVNARNLDGETPLHWAASRNNDRVVRILLTGGARKTLKSWKDRWENMTPFDLASTAEVRDLLRF